MVTEALRNVVGIGYDSYQELILNNSLIKLELQRVLKEEIDKDRDGISVLKPVIQSVLKMLVEISDFNYYFLYFEEFFLKNSLQFYDAEAKSIINEYSCSQYLKKVKSRIDQETERVNLYLRTDANTNGPHPIQSVIDQAFLIPYKNYIPENMANGEIFLLENDRYEDLNLLYSIMNRVNGNVEIRKILETYILNMGNKIIEDPQYNKTKEVTFIQALIDLKEKFENILKKAFQKDLNFNNSISRSFEKILNINPRTPEYLSIYIDGKIRRGNKDINETEIEIVLEKAMEIFRLINEKDLFEKYYKNHLAKRLLFGFSSEEREKIMISKLKNDSGFQFTSKLESMFHDISLSQNFMETFKQSIQEKKLNTQIDPLNGIDLNVNVLTTGSWPTHAQYTSKLPPNLLNLTLEFENFYYKNHSGRKLTWQTSMGTADIKALFKTCRKEFNLSTNQMIILLLFNQKDEFTGKEIQTASGIPLNELKNHLNTLSSSRYPILTVSNDHNNSFDNLDRITYCFNSKFTHKLTRIKIGMSIQREDDSERQITKNKIDEERMIIIDAAIVRTMKRNRTLDHNTLVAEVSSQLMSRFTPKVNSIKKRIESLIEREYMKRSSNERNIYEYVA